jgi:hypothetical protein
MTVEKDGRHLGLITDKAASLLSKIKTARLWVKYFGFYKIKFKSSSSKNANSPSLNSFSLKMCLRMPPRSGLCRVFWNVGGSGREHTSVAGFILLRAAAILFPAFRDVTLLGLWFNVGFTFRFLLLSGCSKSFGSMCTGLGCAFCCSN